MKRHAAATSVRQLVTHVLVGAICFYGGVLLAAHGVGQATDCSKFKTIESMMISRIDKQAEEIDQLKHQFSGDGGSATDTRFPENVAAFAAGLGLVSRDQFAKRFDMGVPIDFPSQDNTQVLLMYGHESTLPTFDETVTQQSKSNTGVPYIENLEQAVENCDTMNVILAQQKEKQCFAFMGQFKSYHIQKWMRLPEEHGKIDHNLPLRFVNRGAQPSGRLSVKAPTKNETLQYWSSLSSYLPSLDQVLQELRPIAASVARKNTVIVMVCNFGQAELLMNFVCASSAHGVDLSTILVFATDTETKELAEGLGLTSFFDEINYGSIPKKAAGRYADKTFTAIMMAKVYCVQMTIMLGYDVLFSDVDMVWYKDPLQFFHNTSSPSYNFDIYFQDDGSRGLFYAPYSANTGFYYIRHNDRTVHFFNSLLLSGDVILSTHSHQIALVGLLSEHASYYGLKVKVISREADEFPGGFNFHSRHKYMRKFLEGTKQPYIFHMSWTENKKNKRKFLEQLGGWYLQDTCIDRSAADIVGNQEVLSGSLIDPCCASEMIFKCHYRDKPSIRPCSDSPPIDKGKPSFW